MILTQIVIRQAEKRLPILKASLKASFPHKIRIVNGLDIILSRNAPEKQPEQPGKIG